MAKTTHNGLPAGGGGPGSPPYKPTHEQRETVKILVANRVNEKKIADVLNISNNTLRLHFKKELKTARVDAMSKVAANLHRIATDPEGGAGTVTAAIWLQKTRDGIRETTALELSGPNGGPMQHQFDPITTAAAMAKQIEQQTDENNIYDITPESEEE